MRIIPLLSRTTTLINFLFLFLRLSLLTTHPCRTKVRNLFMVNWGRRGGGAQRPAQVFVESINRNQIVMEFSLVWGSMYIIEVKVRKCTVKWTRPRPSSAHIRVFMILDFSLLIKFSIAVSRYLWICLTPTHKKKCNAPDGLPHYVFYSPNHVTFDEQNVETSCEKTFTTINTLITLIRISNESLS